MSSRATTGLLCLVLPCLTAQIASAHPADGYTPNDLHPAYGTLGLGEWAEWSVGDIVFTQPYPDPDTLSDIEKYMLEGTQDSWEPGVGLGPWWQAVMNIVVAYDKAKGAIPDTLTADIVRAVSWQPDSVDADTMALLSNPITNQVAWLRSAEYSPGDLYVKRLSDAEIQQVGEKDPLLRDDVQGSRRDPVSGEVRMRLQLTSPVYYIRMYGRDGVILSRLYYTYEPL